MFYQTNDGAGVVGILMSVFDPQRPIIARAPRTDSVPEQPPRRIQPRLTPDPHPSDAGWADSGALNEFRWLFPVESWGRRAPWMVLGLPLMMFGAAGMWLAPSRDDTMLIVW